MTAKDLALTVNAFARDFFGIPAPRAEFATSREMGRSTEGLAFPATRTIWVRQNPRHTNSRFLIAHEIAHIWQSDHGLPLNEHQADELAAACCGHGRGEPE
jgi:hypothetical protein